jgi:hypothetical protein
MTANKQTTMVIARDTHYILRCLHCGTLQRVDRPSGLRPDQFGQLGEIFAEFEKTHRHPELAKEQLRRRAIAKLDEPFTQTTPCHQREALPAPSTDFLDAIVHGVTFVMATLLVTLLVSLILYLALAVLMDLPSYWNGGA